MNTSDPIYTQEFTVPGTPQQVGDLLRASLEAAHSHFHYGLISDTDTWLPDSEWEFAAYHIIARRWVERHDLVTEQAMEYPILADAITLDLEPLAEQTHIIVRCWLPECKPDVDKLLGVLGVPIIKDAPQVATQHDALAPREQRGMKVGTANRVREMHRLLKQGLSQRQAKQRARCDPTTYYRWCLEATGEEPVEPYR